MYRDMSFDPLLAVDDISKSA